MPFELDSVVPWGRRFDEYRSIFNLSGNDLAGRILGCGDGPASFNAEATAMGFDVVSVDPMYDFSTGQIRSRVEAVFEDVIAQVSTNSADFVWGRGIVDLDDLTQRRRSAMDRFLHDFDAGRSQGRYLVGELPTLSLEDRSFDLALCSHFLFLYGEQLSTDFHVRALTELCRVADEVRVFPLLENGSLPSRHLPAVREALSGRGVETRIQHVAYEFQRGGNQLLIASAKR